MKVDSKSIKQTDSRNNKVEKRHFHFMKKWKILRKLGKLTAKKLKIKSYDDIERIAG